MPRDTRDKRARRKDKDAADSSSSSSKDDGHSSDDNGSVPEETRAEYGGNLVAVEDFREDAFFGQTRLREDEEGAMALDPSENLVVLKNVHKTYLLGIEGACIVFLRGCRMLTVSVAFFYGWFLPPPLPYTPRPCFQVFRLYAASV
jgi:hypothetical protein